MSIMLMNMSGRHLTVMCGDNIVSNLAPYGLVQGPHLWQNENSMGE